MWAFKKAIGYHCNCRSRIFSGATFTRYELNVTIEVAETSSMPTADNKLSRGGDGRADVRLVFMTAGNAMIVPKTYVNVRRSKTNAALYLTVTIVLNIFSKFQIMSRMPADLMLTWSWSLYNIGSHTVCLFSWSRSWADAVSTGSLNLEYNL